MTLQIEWWHVATIGTLIALLYVLAPAVRYLRSFAKEHLGAMRAISSLAADEEKWRALALLAKSLEATSTIPFALAGMRQIGMLQLKQAENLAKAVESFRATLFSGSSTEDARRPSPALIEDEELNRYIAGEVEALVQQGVPREEAEDRVRGLAEELKKGVTI